MCSTVAGVPGAKPSIRRCKHAVGCCCAAPVHASVVGIRVHRLQQVAAVSGAGGCSLLLVEGSVWGKRACWGSCLSQLQLVRWVHSQHRMFGGDQQYVVYAMGCQQLLPRGLQAGCGGGIWAWLLCVRY
jgi:hypothetical protein